MRAKRWLPHFRVPPRQLVLFVGAVIVPCGALLVIGARMLSQDRELAGKRDTDEQRRLAASATQLIVGRLELLRSREERALFTSKSSDGYADSATVLSARIVGGKARLPWANPDEPAGGSGRFSTLVGVGQRLEFAEGAVQLRQAVSLYDSATAIAPNEQRKADAQLLAARAAVNGGAWDGHARLRRVAQLSFHLRDEFGVPLALYAQRRLLDDSVESNTAFASRVERDLLPSRGLSPAACSLARTIIAGRGDRTRELRLGARCLALEHAAEVVDAWKPASREVDTAWTLDRSRTLLYSATPSALTVVQLSHVLASLGALSLPIRVVGEGDRGEPLSPALPGLRVVPLGNATAAQSRWRTTRDFYVASMGLVLVTVLSVAFFFWRDTQREIRLAAMRSQFVSGVSHELKTPLTAIRMYAETLRAGRPREPAAREEYLDTIVAESERLSRLLDNVLDFAKIERGTKNYAMEPRDLADIVGDAQRILAHTVTQQGFVLDLELNRDVPPVLMDADAVEQAVLNLIVNAMKYSGDSRRITVRVSREDAWAVVTVIDAGIGIAADEQQRIFEQFYRAPGPQNTSVPGAGLGLTIVGHVAAAHQGKVTVTSELGRGSAFSLHLPLPARTPLIASAASVEAAQ